MTWQRFTPLTLMECRTDDPNRFALLVDPDTDGSAPVRDALRESNLDLAEVHTAHAAMERMAVARPRLVLSELVLPDGSGFALCRQLRESTILAQVPIVLISQWSTERDRILAFECGADDFVGKPFFPRELSSRIKALLRRSETGITPEEPPVTEEIGRLSIDPERREVRLDGAPLALTPREFSLLSTLARHRGRVLSRMDLIGEAWNSGESPTERSVDAHVKSLRRKLEGARDSIQTVRGVGYRYSEIVVDPLG